MNKEYVIINKTAIQKRIEELENLRKNSSSENNDYYQGQIKSLNEVVSQSTPLITVEKKNKRVELLGNFQKHLEDADRDEFLAFWDEEKELFGEENGSPELSEGIFEKLYKHFKDIDLEQFKKDALSD